jgi:hypothetical protein
MHLDHERVQRLLHGELEPGGERRTRAHLAECEDCGTMVDEARSEERQILELLREVDHPIRRPDLRAVLAANRPPRAGPQRWAAGVVLFLAAAGAAYATPGSPIPAAIDRLIGWSQSGRSSPDSAPTAAGDRPDPAGVAVPPGDRLTIRFLESDSAVASVSLGDGDEVVLRALEGAATFVSDVDLLTVRTAGPARFEVLVPSSAPLVDIVVGEQRVFRIQSSTVTTQVRVDGAGRYIIRLARR